MQKRNIPGSKRLQWIDILKAFAMVGVILVHFNNAWSSPINILSKISTLGAKCPQLFFIISAYLTWNGLEKNDNNWKLFYEKRIIRIAPLFYIGIIVSAIIPYFRLTDISAANWVSHFLFFNWINPVWINSIMGTEWYIADLALFYILTPLLWKIVRNLKCCLFLLSCSVIISSSTLILYNNLIDSNNILIEMYFNTFIFIHQFPVIMMGITLFYLIKELSCKELWNLLFITGIVITSITVIFIIKHLDKRYITNSLIAGLLFSWLFLLAFQMRDLFEKNVFKLLAFIGMHSFGIYCFHQIVINCVLTVISQRNFCIWCSTLGLIVLISILVGYLMEKIQGNLMKKFISFLAKL